MSIELTELVAYCDGLLESASIKDYCPNGLQVCSSDRVSVLATAVTASERAIDAAIDLKADALLVHHGYFWKGESEPLVGMKGRRVAKLMRNNISLVAYHLPLDLHPVLGNNAQLGSLLGWECYPASDDGLIWMAGFEAPQAVDSLIGLIAEKLEREPLHIKAGRREVQRIAWCTGAAQSMLTDVESLGAQMFISGEISEPTVHMAREMGIEYVSAGHHATERYGIRALGNHLSEHYAITHHFIDIDNPV